ncbi:MAG: 16S rRNA (adenine(1518)-N(6)/adenine(1519)-N(6))-dimethyltransferase RsmA [Alphaproteobacteria bacterium]
MSETLDTLPPLRDVINAHGLRADKALGQNFLLDQNITNKIARHADAAVGGLAGKHVIEIGPGPGGLTRSLLRSDAQSVTAIEFDPRAIDALSGLQEAAKGRLSLIEGDAMKLDIKSLTPAPRVIVANLPYNIATPLLLGWLKDIYDNPTNFDGFILMFQKEVAQRIVASVSDKPYGRLAVMSNWLCETKKLFDLSPSAFTPPPKVTSSVVMLRPKMLQEDEKPSFKAVETITAAAFGQRRKMIRSSLKDYAETIDALGLDPQLRAENLDVVSYIKLAKLFT